MNLQTRHERLSGGVLSFHDGTDLVEFWLICWRRGGYLTSKVVLQQRLRQTIEQANKVMPPQSTLAKVGVAIGRVRAAIQHYIAVSGFVAETASLGFMSYRLPLSEGAQAYTASARNINHLAGSASAHLGHRHRLIEVSAGDSSPYALDWCHIMLGLRLTADRKSQIVMEEAT